MAEKIVELSKIAPFGLKRPSASDIAMLAKSTKTSNNQIASRQLWTHEKRMFAERTIHLNKSTTKYLIIGNDFTTFEPTMKICDRTTGSHVTISTTEKINNFCKIVRHIVYGDEDESIDGDAGVLVEPVSPELYKISLQQFTSNDICIIREVKLREEWSSKYPKIIEIIRADVTSTPQMSQEEKLYAIYQYMSRVEEDEQALTTEIAFGIIINRSYLQGLEAYAAFYN